MFFSRLSTVRLVVRDARYLALLISYSRNSVQFLVWFFFCDNSSFLTVLHRFRCLWLTLGVDYSCMTIDECEMSCPSHSCLLLALFATSVEVQRESQEKLVMFMLRRLFLGISWDELEINNMSHDNENWHDSLFFSFLDILLWIFDEDEVMMEKKMRFSDEKNDNERSKSTGISLTNELALVCTSSSSLEMINWRWNVSIL